MAEDVREADEWQKSEHDAVFRTLDRALANVEFPATKNRIAARVGGEPVTDESSVPLLKYVEALPERSYRNSEDVKHALDDRWQELLGYRDAGYEASTQGGER